MSISFRVFLINVVFSCWVLGRLAAAQTRTKVAPQNVQATAERAIDLAEKGRCREAVPALKGITHRLTSKQLKYAAAIATARCGMSLDQTETAVQALLLLQREFPHDPDVLYMTTHFYAELASRASQELAASAPDSPQAGQLEAEGLESQGNWDRAVAQYRKLLEQNTRLRNIHYRLGRIYLAQSPPQTEEAKKEFEEEIKIAPQNASAQFMLGEIARQAGQWDEAIGYFMRASKLDEDFVEAYLALGMTLNSSGKFSDALSPLQTYVKLQPADPAGHYQLATAYMRTGHRQEADQEMALQKEASAKQPQGQR
jgi:tetratricopeptide (TPR) repeat protein